eukprot:1153869-Pelagomonas_calceolata.AAC.3
MEVKKERRLNSPNITSQIFKSMTPTPRQCRNPAAVTHSYVSATSVKSACLTPIDRARSQSIVLHIEVQIE